MGWHITCFKIWKYDENGEKVVVNTHHCSVLTENEKKESAVNLGLFMTSLEMFSISNPDIKYAYVTCDNAG